MHTSKKTAARKEEKTHNAGEKVLKSAQIKAKSLIQEAEKIKQIRKSRKVYWFEKFLWFITSENYLCIAGKDAIQNEQIVKRYLQKGDAYIHADIHGAASVVLKNHSKTRKLPPKSLEEAGNFALINSSAWEAKIVSGIYWVESHQVSKTAQSGEFLSTGSFMIRGKKNFLPGSAQNLTIGYGFLFKLEEDSLERHKNERIVHHELERMDGCVSEEENPDSESDIDLSADEDGSEDHKIEKSNKQILEEMSENDDESEDGSGDGSENESEDEKPFGGIEMTEMEKQLLEMEKEFEEEESKKKSKKGKNKNKKTEPKSEQKPEQQSKPKNQTKSDPKSSQPDSKPEPIEFPESSLTAPDMSTKKSRKHKKSQNLIPTDEEEEYSPVGKPNTAKVRSIPAWKQEKIDAGKKPGTQVRRKKGNNKKIKKKYGDQDEEEKAQILAMLQAEALKNQGKKEPKRRKGRSDAANSAPSIGKVLKKQIAKNEKLAAIAAEGEIKIRKKPEKSENSETPETAESKPGPSIKIETVVKAPEPEIDVKIDFSELSELTSQPHVEDTMMFALPMVAPYSTMQKFKFKVKMVPGTNKKGKTAKTVLEGFLRDKHTTQLEKDLLKAITHDDLFKNLPGKVKLVNTGKK